MKVTINTPKTMLDKFYRDTHHHDAHKLVEWLIEEIDLGKPQLINTDSGAKIWIDENGKFWGSRKVSRLNFWIREQKKK